MITDETRRLRALEDIQQWIKRPLEYQPTTINPDGTPKTAKDLLDAENFDVEILLKMAEDIETCHVVLWQSWDIGGPSQYIEGVSLTTGEIINLEVIEES